MIAISEGSSLITTNVIHRVFQIKFKNNVATGFTIDVDGRQYIVTARHVVEGISEGEKLNLLHDNIWKKIEIQVIGVGSGLIDISVLSSNQQVSPSLPLPPDMAGLVYGQEAYFLGFPYGMYGDVGLITQDWPLPFVKSAIVSCVFKKDEVATIFLDGYNNRGFSGGPVVFKEPNKNDFKVAGVISGYRFSDEPTFSEGQETNISYRENTGIIIAYSIKHAVDLIKENPNGFLLATN